VGLPGIILSAISVTVGAILYWTVTSIGQSFRLSTVRRSPILVSAGGFVVSAIAFGMFRRSNYSHALLYVGTRTPGVVPVQSTKWSSSRHEG